MGIVIDSTVLIAAERAGKNSRGMIEEIAAACGDTEAILSVITRRRIGARHRTGGLGNTADYPERFIRELLNEVPVEPITVPIAFRAGRLDGSLRAMGLRIALGDLLIGTTALELGYAVLTHNVRHFRMIPSLTVAQL